MRCIEKPRKSSQSASGGLKPNITIYVPTTEAEYRRTCFFKIKQLIINHPNVYADVSHSLAEEDNFRKIAVENPKRYLKTR